MEGSFLRVTAVTALLALLAAAIVTVAPATPTTASGCSRDKVIKTVFPTAGTVGFNTRRAVTLASIRTPSPGLCGTWRTTYTDERMSDRRLPRPHRAFAQVRVSLYRTHGDAIVALYEPAFGASVELANGTWIRTYVDRQSANGDPSRQIGYVASVVGNVFILSYGQGRPPAYQGREAVRAQMRIHRRIQATVLAFG